jgi:hypothetical protein
MKKILFLTTTVLTIILVSSCEVLNQLPTTLNTGTTGPSDSQIGMGLKEALEQGISKGVEQLMKTDGYFKNELIKILLPEDAQKVVNVIQKMPGGQKLMDDAVLKMNRAAEDAAQEAKPIFVNAIKALTIQDAKKILFGAENEATNYLKGQTYQNLSNVYSPKINNSLSKAGATQAWDALSTGYNKFIKSPAGLLFKDAKPVTTDLGAYVTEKALNGLFFKVTEEEKNIRQNIAARSSQLLKDVFGLLEKK